MNADVSGSTLLDALNGLESTARALHRASQHQSAPQLERLHHAVESLGLTTTARPPRGSDEYLRHWERYLADPRQPLTKRALKCLCWEPDVATTSRFQDCLDRDVGELSPLMLQGLVYSCHKRWSQVWAAGGGVAHYVEQRLETYRGTHRVLVRWREHTAMLLGLQGHCIFGNSLIQARVPIKKHCEEWAFKESSQYVLEAVRHAVHACQGHLGRDTALCAYLLTTLLPWEEWPIQDFHTAVGTTILHPLAARDLKLQEALTKLVLQDSRLGDPRLPRNIRNWLGIQEARQRLLQWLSRADIHFFFDHVLPKGTDPHGRKTFWLKYVSRVLMSRPLLNRDDEVRLHVTMQSLQGQVGHFGRVSSRETSAFLLDFGDVVVVEFSRVGSSALNRLSLPKTLVRAW